MKRKNNQKIAIATKSRLIVKLKHIRPADIRCSFPCVSNISFIHWLHINEENLDFVNMNPES